MLIGKKPTGTLVADNLLPGKTLWMLSTGTGLAPFMSIIRDPDIYDRFDKVILTHTCRLKGELAYMDYIKHDLPGLSTWATSSRKARLLPDGHARSVRQRRPDHRPDRDGQAVHGSRRPAVLAGKRPRDAVRQHRDAEGHDRAAEAGRPRRRQEQRAGPLRDRARVRGLIDPQFCAASGPERKLRFSSLLGEFVTNWDHPISNSYIWIRHGPAVGVSVFPTTPSFRLFTFTLKCPPDMTFSEILRYYSPRAVAVRMRVEGSDASVTRRNFCYLGRGRFSGGDRHRNGSRSTQPAGV